MTLIREGESPREAAHRVATDAIYHERDHDGDMGTAGTAAAEAVLAVAYEAAADKMSFRQDLDYYDISTEAEGGPKHRA